MLHLESWKGSKKGYFALTFQPVALLLALSTCMLLTSCGEGRSDLRRQLSKEQLAELQNANYALSIPQMDECLERIVSKDYDTTYFAGFVGKYYELNGHHYSWITRGGVDSKADTLLHYLEQRVPEMGFSPKFFHLSEIREELEQARNLDSSEPLSVRMARLDYHLSRAFLYYVEGQRYGFTDPYRVHNRISPRKVDSLGRALSYNRLYDVKVERPNFHTADSLIRLYHAQDPEEAVAFLQSQEPTDTLYHRLQKKLQQSSDADERTRLMVNMERRRWRTQQPSSKEKYILVNLAARQLWAYNPGDTVLNMRIVCGALKTKTPQLSSKVHLLQINPEWNIPMSIIRGDVARHAGNPGYFSSRRYYIASRSTGKRVSAASVTAAQLASGAYRVAQESGAGNSLGRLIFRFPNNFDVFLHDTSNRGAFQQDLRLLSHGCVRLQRPFDLARFALSNVDDWTLDRIRLSIDMAPETEKGKDYLTHRTDSGRIRLINSHPVTPNIPLYISYYTIYPDPSTGNLQTWPDVYGYDKEIYRAIKPFI